MPCLANFCVPDSAPDSAQQVASISTLDSALPLVPNAGSDGEQNVGPEQFGVKFTPSVDLSIQSAQIDLKLGSNMILRASLYNADTGEFWVFLFDIAMFLRFLRLASRIQFELNLNLKFTCPICVPHGNYLEHFLCRL